MPSRCAIWWIGTLVLTWSSLACAEEFLPASNQKVRVSRQVFDQLVRSVNDPRTPPEFRIVKGKATTFDVAQFLPGRHAVYLEEEFYDLLQSSLPKEQANGLALILGHELAHFYRNHRWAEGFGRAFAHRQTALGGGESGEDVPRIESAKERRRLEAEADYFGGFYSFLAGYQPLSVATPVFDAIYTHYRFDPGLPAYEHLKHRRETAKEAQQRLRELAPLFETGVYALLIGDYTSSGLIFDRIATEFPGPEILNNAGVAEALDALQWFSETENRFVYPFEIDSESRLAGEGQRGMTFADPEQRRGRRNDLLEQARRHLEKAVAMNPSYAMALLNLACVFDLLGDYESAGSRAEAARLLAQSQGAAEMLARAHAVKGIVFSHQGDDESAKREFGLAANSGNGAGVENLARINAPAGRASLHVAEPRTLALPEQVGDMKIADLGEGEFMNPKDTRTLARWDADDELRPALTVVSRQRGTVRATAIIKGSGSMRSSTYLLSGRQGAEGRTIKGVRRGDTVNVVERAYGSPNSVFVSGRGRYYLYQSPYRDERVGIIFRFDDKQAVESWVAFRSAHRN
ncbi:hypothetical protein W02_17350 [Nitrospira sp. KM1]|uniref:tetratricopeptide repeat protein n=1 Tax=Nitrospira sp. KM1 TaxID=1936990 RepID=UPI0013A79261|nr:tetratricopeptide repeat protein [Nitrospira sp. KM1]BCA54595.1 hypothetical protein W02_17350 [Nitrospira sp. KM1]